MPSWRIDLMKEGEQHPLMTEIPSQREADAILRLFGKPCEEWDSLVAVHIEDGPSYPDLGTFTTLLERRKA